MSTTVRYQEPDRMFNLEIKARIEDLKAAEKAAAELCGPVPHAELTQVDTYFSVPEGRLKLREEKGPGGVSSLIYYRRPLQPEPKCCEYEMVTVGQPERLRLLLESALGIETVVDKRRTVYLYEKVRIHLDRVRGLGTFLELEAVMPDGFDDELAASLLDRLMRRFALSKDDLIEGSYSDLVGR